jgi:hypothetical protein
MTYKSNVSKLGPAHKNQHRSNKLSGTEETQIDRLKIFHMKKKQMMEGYF